ncbi:MAG: SGNH/GDSL hydrolase family protein [Myxococcota bacterium]
MRRALSGLLAIGLVFALLEGAASLLYFAWWGRMHWWSPLPERAHTVYDPELGWASQPSRVARDVFGPGLHVTTNARGFRNAAELANDVPAGKLRVVALGDSFTLGYDVGDGDSWPAWLEKLCPGLEVPNMGQSGYGIDQSYLWYRRDAADLEHQLLVLAFIDDDLRRVLTDSMAGYGKPVLELRDGQLVATHVPVPRAPYLWPALTQNLSLFEKLRVVELPRAIAAHFAGDASEPPAEGTDGDAEQLDVAILRSLRASAEARGALLVLVHLPHLVTGNPAELAELPKFGAAVVARLAAEGVPFADLREELSREPDPARRALFQPDTALHGPGGHYSAQGNRFMAAAIAERLVAQGAIPRAACSPPPPSGASPPRSP